MNVKKNISLKAYNTFGVDVKASHFVEVHSISDIQKVYNNPEFSSLDKLILGGGSNLLFTKDWNGLVIHNKISGAKITGETNNYALIEAGSGIIWHQLVEFAIKHNLGGIENLSLIPGTVGAAPLQNIGAYGVEIKDTLQSVTTYDIANDSIKIFGNEECQFGYRDSYFKKEGKGKYFVLNVVLKLSKQPIFNTSYGALREIFGKTNPEDLTIEEVSKAVIQIRKSKLPDPKEIGNAGSFFKNPVVKKQLFAELTKQYPEMPFYAQSNSDEAKIPAGWLIEQCGWKGKRIGQTGSHAKQSLVLVNYGNATGTEIHDLAMEIEKSVLEKFNITLEPEVNIL